MTDTTTSFSYLTATLWIGIGAVIAAFVTGRAVRLVKISEHRQNWINALRDDVAEFIADAHSVQADTKDLISLSPELAQRDELQRRINTKKDGADTLLLKIILRLNPKEDDHIELEKLLNELREGKAINAELEKRAIEQARIVFKREWDVAKYGELVDIRLWLKSLWRKTLARLKIRRAPNSRA
jgi:hypothetical protein